MAQISFAVTAKLISALVFATRIVQFLLYLTPKFQASSSFLCLYRSVCVRPVRKPHCWFSHEAAHTFEYLHSVRILFHEFNSLLVFQIIFQMFCGSNHFHSTSWIKEDAFSEEMFYLKDTDMSRRIKEHVNRDKNGTSVLLACQNSVSVHTLRIENTNAIRSIPKPKCTFQ